jgi:hypothetical protein
MIVEQVSEAFLDILLEVPVRGWQNLQQAMRYFGAVLAVSGRQSKAARPDDQFGVALIQERAKDRPMFLRNSNLPQEPESAAPAAEA